MRGERAFTGFNLSRFHEGSVRCSDERANFTLLIVVDDVDGLYARVVEGGVTPETVPENQLWRGRAFSMRDLNGIGLVYF